MKLDLETARKTAERRWNLIHTLENRAEIWETVPNADGGPFAVQIMGRWYYADEVQEAADHVTAEILAGDWDDRNFGIYEFVRGLTVLTPEEINA